MNIIGVVMEINPFHNGHKYFLSQVNKKPGDILIAVISTTIVQRGEFSILNKHHKAQLLLDHNVDLVVEIPSVLVNQGGEYFAKIAIEILQELKINTIYFGSESNNLDLLIKIANSTQTNNFKKGIHKETLQELKSNDILGISYLKSLDKNIKINLVKRIENNYNDISITTKKFISATSIRNNLNNKDIIKDYLPTTALNLIKENEYDSLYDLFIINLNNAVDNNFNIFLSEDNQLLFKIKKILKTNNINNFETLIDKAKDKNNSQYKIKRIILNTILMVDQNKVEHNIEYIRILGFNKNGQLYLKTLQNDLCITSLKNLDSYNAKCEIRFSQIYNMISNQTILHDYIAPIVK